MYGNVNNNENYIFKIPLKITPEGIDKPIHCMVLYA